jgi:hypothetical protein
MRKLLIPLLLCTTVAVLAQEPAGLNGLVGPATADRAINAGSGVELQASTDNTTATIKASRTASGPGTTFSTWQALASAPLSKGGDSTAIATAQGFPDSFSLTGKYVGYAIPATTLDPNNPAIKETCAVMRAGAKAKGLSDDDVKKLECDEGNMAKYAPQEFDRFDALFWDTTKADVMWGGSATIGYRQFQYLQTTADKAKATKNPWGLSAFFGVIPPRVSMLVTGGIDYRKKYKEADAGTLCPPAGTTTTQCKTGAIGPPQKNDQKLAYIELRRLFKGHAASLKTGYDAASHHWSADLPIYLIASPTGALTGGIRASWEQTKDFQFGVFVGSSFSLFPF